MDRVGGFRWWLRAMLARRGWTGYRSSRFVQVPGPFWRRWWHVLRHHAPPLPADFRPPPFPPWAGPPESELGVATPLRIVVVAQPRLVVALVDCVAYSNGF